MINITNEAIQLCNGLQKSDFKTIKQKNVLAEDIQIYMYMVGHFVYYFILWRILNEFCFFLKDVKTSHLFGEHFDY